jgi:hypothetical protein
MPRVINPRQEKNRLFAIVHTPIIAVREWRTTHDSHTHRAEQMFVREFDCVELMFVQDFVSDKLLHYYGSSLSNNMLDKS